MAYFVANYPIKYNNSVCYLKDEVITDERGFLYTADIHARLIRTGHIRLEDTKRTGSRCDQCGRIFIDSMSYLDHKQPKRLTHRHNQELESEEYISVCLPDIKLLPLIRGLQTNIHVLACAGNAPGSTLQATAAIQEQFRVELGN